MWFAVLVLLGIIAALVLALVEKLGHIDNLRIQVRREHSLRVATEVAFCALLEDQLGDRLRSNMRRVSETTARFDKARGDGRGPN
jgi:hypothetical protein